MMLAHIQSLQSVVGYYYNTAAMATCITNYEFTNLKSMNDNPFAHTLVQIFNGRHHKIDNKHYHGHHLGFSYMLQRDGVKHNLSLQILPGHVFLPYRQIYRTPIHALSCAWMMQVHQKQMFLCQ